MKTGYKLFYLLLFSVLIINTTCKKEINDPRDFPRVKTLEVTNISERGATFRGEIVSFGSEPIIGHGFVWGITETGLSILSSNRIMLGVYDNGNSFDATISTSLEKGLTYYVRAFVQSKSHIVYGFTISFESLGSEAPEITGFEPKTASWGEIVTIKGKNFSWQSNLNKIYFGSILSQIHQGSNINTDSSLSVIVPGGLKDLRALLSVDLAGNSSTFTSDTFSLALPSLAGFYPLQGHWGDTISIFGNNLRSLQYLQPQVSVYFGNAVCNKIIYHSRDTIKVIVPNDLTQSSSNIKIIAHNFNFNAPNTFNFKPPILTNFIPNEAFYNDIITVYGKFNTEPTNNQIIFNPNAIQGTITYTSRDSLQVRIPKLLTRNNYITYKAKGFTVSSTTPFVITQPVINSFSPTSGVVGTEVKINVEYIYQESYLLSVYFGNSKAQVTSITSNSITVKVPYGVQGNVKIRLVRGSDNANSQVESEEYFNVIHPHVSSFSPLYGSFSDTITILGENFGENNIVHFHNDYYEYDDFIATVVSQSGSVIKVLVPNDIMNVASELIVDTYYGDNSVQLKAPGVFTLLLPEIHSVSPVSGYAGQIVTLEGVNFNPIMEYNIVHTIGVEHLSLLSTSKTRIEFTTEMLTNGVFPFYLSVSNMFDVEANQPFNCISPWINLEIYDYDFFGNSPASSFVIDNEGYVIWDNGFRKYNHQDNSWTALNPPLNPLYKESFFTIDNKIYYVFGRNNNTQNIPSYKVESFDIYDNSWTTLNNFPGNGRHGAIAFSFENKAIVGGGFSAMQDVFYSDFWEYDPNLDSWTRKSDFVLNPNRVEITNSFTLNEKGYLMLGDNSFWEYNPQNDVWTRLNDFPFENIFEAVSFIIEDKVYMGSGRFIEPKNDWFEYDYKTDTWHKRIPIPIDLLMQFGFSIDGKGYVGGFYEEYYYNSCFEYDPTYEP